MAMMLTEPFPYIHYPFTIITQFHRLFLNNFASIFTKLFKIYWADVAISLLVVCDLKSFKGRSHFGNFALKRLTFGFDSSDFPSLDLEPMH